MFSIFEKPVAVLGADNILLLRYCESRVPRKLFKKEGYPTFNTFSVLVFFFTSTDNISTKCLGTLIFEWIVRESTANTFDPVSVCVCLETF